MMRWVLFLLFTTIFGANAGAEAAVEYPGVIPPLSAEQTIQLATADDTRPPDEPAWTGLLTNIASWNPATAGVGSWVNEAGDLPAKPNYPALLEAPAAYRGDLFVVEGKYAGRQREMRTLRGGPWGESLKEWGVVVTPDTGEPGGEFVAMVYLVDPQGKITPPREGQTVRMLTRFYKTWTDVDAGGVERAYPVFVGRSASVVENAAAAGRGNLLIVGGVGALAAVLVLLMLARKRRAGRASKREAVLERLRREVDDTEDQDSIEGLPDDPAAALAQLERSQNAD